MLMNIWLKLISMKETVCKTQNDKYESWTVERLIRNLHKQNG